MYKMLEIYLIYGTVLTLYLVCSYIVRWENKKIIGIQHSGNFCFIFIEMQMSFWH